MKKRILGSTGFEVSEIGIGTAVFGIQNYLIPWAGSDDMDRRARETISRALDLGCNYIDTAPGYGDCEERLGRVLPSDRDGLFVATKILTASPSMALMAYCNEFLDRARGFILELPLSIIYNPLLSVPI